MIGDVSLGEDVSVWPTAVIRGDVERIVIGARSNVQDGAVIHADPGKPTIVGEDCVIGHRAVVHGTILEDGVLVGMGAILLNHVRVGRGSIIAAGAVVTEGTQVPPGSLVVGVPGKVVRALSAEQQAGPRTKVRERRGGVSACCADAAVADWRCTWSTVWCATACAMLSALSSQLRDGATVLSAPA